MTPFSSSFLKSGFKKSLAKKGVLLGHRLNIFL
jgi:hypothetical protein